jgi:hypothetical protein
MKGLRGHLSALRQVLLLLSVMEEFCRIGRGEYLFAALPLWDYAEASARYISDTGPVY